MPLRRVLERHRFSLGVRGGAAAGAMYGFLTGGTTGVGVILLSILMSMGLSGTHVIATDALTSTILGLVKSGVFLWAGELPPKFCLVALLIGGMATPGTLVAKWMTQKFSAKIHDRLIEGTIIVGGLILLFSSLTRAAA